MVRPESKQYLLVYGRKSQKWGFPKGHMEASETEEETARREFEEETGVPLRGSCRTRIRFRNNIYFLVSAALHEHDEYRTKDPREIETVRWMNEEEMIGLPVESCNFGLKNWIYMMVHKPQDVRDLMMEIKKNEDASLFFYPESTPQRKRLEQHDPDTLFHVQQNPGSIRRNV